MTNDNGKSEASFLDVNAKLHKLDLTANTMDIQMQAMLSAAKPEIDTLPDDLKAAVMTHIALVQQASIFLRAVATYCDPKKMEFIEVTMPDIIPNIEAAINGGLQFDQSLKTVDHTVN